MKTNAERGRDLLNAKVRIAENAVGQEILARRRRVKWMMIQPAQIIYIAREKANCVLIQTNALQGGSETV